MPKASHDAIGSGHDWVSLSNLAQSIAPPLLATMQVMQDLVVVAVPKQSVCTVLTSKLNC